MHQYNYVAKTVDNLIKDIPNTAKRKTYCFQQTCHIVVLRCLYHNYYPLKGIAS